jgi:NADPH-dependent glutamate synthase beta subunit-like oxidoreductase
MSVYDSNRIHYPDAPAEFADDTSDAHFVPAPCQAACPVGTDAPSYIAYIWEGKLKEAFEAVTATNPFSSICGRVCDAPCEPACRRTSSDGPVMIRNLKRFVMDEVGNQYDPPPVPVTQDQTIGIVGAGPAGLTAAHDLSVAGYKVHVYEMSDRPGGLMVWGVPAFRLPVGVIQEDIDRLMRRCPELELHLNCALGRDVHLEELKDRHDAVLLTIGAWWGKQMGVPGEAGNERVVDGVGFLKRVNGGERPTLPETVVVIGGGDVAMDACRIAKRLPGCKHVKVLYRRSSGEITARRIELEGALKEAVEFTYNTLQVGVTQQGDELLLHCVKTEPGTFDETGQPNPVPGSEHDIRCGLVVAAVGQVAECEELNQLGMMSESRVHADFDGMSTCDPKVFAAGDGAFGGSTIVMAMHHGQRAAYYIKSFLQGLENPLSYRTPYRTRRVPVAQDLKWELFPVQEPEFFGLGKSPVEFPEIESTYDLTAARAEAARCYRCDAETGSADYSVQHREDIFSMARIQPGDHEKNWKMLQERLISRENAFPEDRPATLDDLVFLPANLSRLVIDPYREACAVEVSIAGKLDLPQPFLLAGFDAAPEEVRRPVAAGLREAGCGYVGSRPIGEGVPWLQMLCTSDDLPSRDAAGLIVGGALGTPPVERVHADQILGVILSSPGAADRVIQTALDHAFDFVLIDGSGISSGLAAELQGPPNLTLLRDAIAALRRLNQEERVDLVYYGGVRSGTDAAKLIALGAGTIVLGAVVGLAAGGEINEPDGLAYASNYSEEDRRSVVVNIIKASSVEASMMARCTGKTRLHNLEPEDLRSITLATAEAAGIPLAGVRAV